MQGENVERLSTAERQVQIKRAILEIISREGLGALSTRRLAKQVGLSEGALFRHFASKRDMLLSIMDDVQTELVMHLRQIALSTRPAEARLHDFLCAHVNYLLAHRGITILLFSEATHMNDSELKRRLRNILLTQKQYVGKIIQDGIVEGQWDEELHVENVATLYMGIPITLNIELVLNPDGLDTDHFCQRMLCLLKRILEKRAH